MIPANIENGAKFTEVEIAVYTVQSIAYSSFVRSTVKCIVHCTVDCSVNTVQ